MCIREYGLHCTCPECTEHYLKNLMNTSRKQVAAYGESHTAKARRGLNGFWPHQVEDGRKHDSFKRASKVTTYTMSQEEVTDYLNRTKIKTVTVDTTITEHK